MSETTTKMLHEGKFLSLKLHDNPDFKYEFTHEQRCDGHIVAVLPVHPEYGMLIRNEFTSCWGEDELHISSITGGWEKDKHPTPIDTAIAELREEAGIVLESEDQLISLGTCRGAKSSDSVYHLFAADLGAGFTEVDIVGDGSHLETLAHNEWVPHGFDGDSLVGLEWFENGADPLLHVMYLRFRFSLDDSVIASREDYE